MHVQKLLGANFNPSLTNHDKKESESDQEIPQLHTANHPMAPRGRAKEHQQSLDIRKII